MAEQAASARANMAFLDAREGHLEDARDAKARLAVERPGDTTLRLFAAALVLFGGPPPPPETPRQPPPLRLPHARVSPSPVRLPRTFAADPIRRIRRLRRRHRRRSGW